MPKLPSSNYFNEISQESDNIDCIIEGPLSIDISLSPEIASAKKWPGQIKGDADIIVTPDIVSGNTLSKSLLMFGDSEMSGIIMGAKVPIILTSRSSSANEKYASILLSQIIMKYEDIILNKIVVINPGATSTKVAYFEDEEQVWKDEILYTSEQMSHFKNIFDQFEMRSKDVISLLEEHGITKDLDAVVGRGGGCSASAHHDGDIVDFISDDEVMFSAERSGGIAIKSLIPLIKEMGIDSFYKFARNEAGLQSYFGTKDLRIIENRINEGDQEAKLVVEAMALSIAKTIACLAATLEGKVDAVCMTGGMAYSEFLREEVRKRTEFIGKFMPYPGEFEMVALAKGGNRVLNNEETAHRLSEMN